jgi:hypothetical protein
VVSFVLGYVLSNSRLTVPEKKQYYLTLAHRNALFEAFMMLGLVFAVILADLSESIKVIAVLLVVASAVFQVGSGIVAWLQGTTDEFAERSLSFYLATINAIMVTAGVAILLFGVARAILDQGF